MRHNQYYDKNKEEKNGICVVLREDENYENLLKRFKKKVTKSGIVDECKKKMRYESPSDKRRRRKLEAYKKYRKIRLEKEKHLEYENKYK